MATAAILHYRYPFPQDNFFLRVIALRAPQAFFSFKYLYYALLFTTPYVAYSTVLSGLYMCTLKARRRISPGRLPRYPDPSMRDDLFLVVGEVHNPRQPGPAQAPYWLTIPERGLFTGIAIFGAIGSGKTSCCMLPFAEQVLAYKAGDKDKRIGGLILEVKGDSCRKVKDLLDRHQRSQDYIEISLDSEYRYNPLHNDLDAYALAYNIASLLNNLFGKGKEPFWQQGHSGTLSTIHANSAKQGLARFTSCVLQSGVELPYRAIKTNIADSLNVVIQIKRRPGRHFISEVLEINSYNPDADLYDISAVFTLTERNPVSM